MSQYNNYECLPLILTPIGPTGATGSTGATGASGTNGTSIVATTLSTVQTSTTMTWETLGDYTLNVDSSTGLLADNGDRYQLDAMIHMVSVSANNRQFRVNIAGLFAPAYYASDNDYVKISLLITRVSATTLSIMGTATRRFASYPEVIQDSFTVPTLDSNTLNIKIQGYNPTANAAEKVELLLATVAYMKTT